MGEPTADVRAAMEKMRDALPEEDKDGHLGKITYALQFLQSGWSFRQAQQHVGELYTLGQHVGTIELSNYQNSAERQFRKSVNSDKKTPHKVG